MAILRKRKLKKPDVDNVSQSKFSKHKKRKSQDKFDEISSGSELDEEEIKTAIQHSNTDDENETAQEKKIRLTKKYLEQLNQLQQHDASDNERDLVGEKLKEDVLEQAGKLQRKIADKCVAPSSESISVLRGHRLSVLCLAVSNDGTILFTGSKDCAIIKWDLKTHKKISMIKGGKKVEGISHKNHILCLALSSDMKHLASGSTDKLIHIWDPMSLKHIHTFKGHRDAVSGLAFRLNSQQLFSTSHDRTVKVWDMEGMGYVETLFGHQDAVQACDSLVRERCITAGGRDGTLRIWKIVEESQLVFQGHLGSIDCVRFINEGHMISGADDGSVCLWSLMKKRPSVVIPKAHSTSNGSNVTGNWISAIAALPNSDLVATGSCNGYIRVWKCGDNFLKLTTLFNIHVPGFVNDLRFADNGATLIAAVGQEHKLGRWWSSKEAKNGVWVITLQPKSCSDS